MTPEEIDTLVDYVTKARLPVSAAKTTLEQVERQNEAVATITHLRAELARVTAERDSAFERGRNVGMEQAAKKIKEFIERHRIYEHARGPYLKCVSIIRALIDHPATDAESHAVRDVIAERKRQISAEVWTPKHDDEHKSGEIAGSAAYYAISGTLDAPHDHEAVIRFLRQWWPWSEAWWKPKDHRSDLVRAGALIIAEIERLDRLEDKHAADAESEARNGLQ